MFDKSKLARYQQLARLLIKYGRRDVIEAASAELGTDAGASGAEPDDMPSPEDLTEDLAALGPTFVKLAQTLSTRGDLLSQPYLDALSRLQDDVAPFGFETVERIVSEELGARLSKVFAEFDPVPMAAASLGQVHRATLRSGEEVVVKVQRPDVREQIHEDLEIFAALAGAVDRNTEVGRRFQFSGLVEQFRKALVGELDYRQEARNLLLFNEELSEFELLVVPRPIEDLSTRRVLTMEFIRGRSISSVSGLARADLDTAPLVDELCRAYLHQVLVAGCFHCDPHPGNLLLTEDHRIGILDLGMVAYVDPELRVRLLRLLLALCDGRGRETAELGLELGQHQADADVAKLTEEVSDLVARRRNRAGEGRKLGRTLLDLVRIFGMNGVRPPAEISLLGKTLLTLDEVAHTLDPEFDPDTVFNRYAEEVMRRQVLSHVNPSQAFSKLLDMHGVAAKLPRRLSVILDDLAAGDFKVRVHTLDENRLLSALEKIGNRIALGLVLAALIVGAALVMQVETDLTLFGYPALAIVLFLAAVVFGFGMVAYIAIFERR